MKLKIHVICLALNEEIFIEEFLKALYPFVQGISVITQYDRDYYGNKVVPDRTVEKVLKFPDIDGKIHLVVRRFNDETAARNHEMNALNHNPAKSIVTHGTDITNILEFHKKPDYYLIADADEIYDSETFPSIMEYLAKKKPNGMRITGYNYYWTWNQRVPKSHEHFLQFGFVRPGLRFKIRRLITFNETRIRKQLLRFHIPDFSAKLYGFIECPESTGVFHHGTYLGDEKRHREKLAKHSHKHELDIENYISNLKNVPTLKVLNKELPKNIVNGNWPKNFFLNSN
jgi:hypothetical protein